MTPNEPRILVVGATGQVGTALLAELGDQALPTARTAKAGWVPLDLADLADVSSLSVLDKHPLSAVLCVGAMTWVDGCEDQPELAFRVNAQAPGVLAKYASARGLPFVFFSTEYVFDGAENNPGPYAETAPCNPLSVYGKSKLEGEQRVLEADPEALILRTTVVFGPDPRQKNFVHTVIQRLTQGTPLDVPNDQVSTPTYNRDLVRATLGLVEQRASGIFHVVGPDLMDRYAFAQEIATTLSLNSSLLRGVATDTLHQKAPRPLHAGLASTKLRATYPALAPRSVADSLADCAAEISAPLRNV